MRIGDPNPPSLSAAGAAGARKREDEDSAGAPVTSLSNDAVALSRLSRAVAEPVPSTPRIERLRREVKAGSYDVPASTLATKLVNFMKE